MENSTSAIERNGITKALAVSPTCTSFQASTRLADASSLWPKSCRSEKWGLPPIRPPSCARTKALSVKRIGWLYPIFRDLHFYPRAVSARCISFQAGTGLSNARVARVARILHEERVGAGHCACPIVLEHSCTGGRGRHGERSRFGRDRQSCRSFARSGDTAHSASDAIA